MRHFLKLFLTAAGACIFAATAVYAHAFLDRANPGVGMTVQAAPRELTLRFTEDVVVAFSGVSLRTAEGQAVPVGKPVVAGGGNVLHVRIGRHLKPGTYVVSWHVVSVDTHRTSGTYRFTIAP